MATKITFGKVAKMLVGAQCAYLYSDGDLIIVTETNFRGKIVRISSLIRKFCSVDFGEYVEHAKLPRKGRVVIHDRATGAFALKRPKRVSVYFGASSDTAKKANMASAGMYIEFDSGAHFSIDYLHRVGAPSESYIATSDITIQPNTQCNSQDSGEINEEFTLDEPTSETSS